MFKDVILGVCAICDKEITSRWKGGERRKGYGFASVDVIESMIRLIPSPEPLPA